MITLVQRYDQYNKYPQTIGVIVSDDFEQSPDQKIDKFVEKSRDGNTVLKDKRTGSYREVELHGGTFFYFTTMIEIDP